MELRYGDGNTKYGPGVTIELTGDEVATAINAWVLKHGMRINGPMTVKVNGELCEEGIIYVDPSGYVLWGGKEYTGRGETLPHARCGTCGGKIS